MKRVLIITYYWPPSGGAGVQRWVKFAKYLPLVGWEPVILTVDPLRASYPQLDESLLNDVAGQLPVFHTKTCEPYSFYKKVSSNREIPYGGFANTKKQDFKEKILRFIRGNFFVPDPRRGWNRFAYKKAVQLIRDYNIQYVITTSPPHSTQLIGMKLSKKLPVRWIADLRDPWTDIYYFKDLYPVFWTWQINRYLERKVLETADLVFTVSGSLKTLFLSKGKIAPDKVKVVFNGFDEEDFEVTEKKKHDNQLVIGYFGTISAGYNISGLIDSASHLSEETRKRIHFRFTGSMPEEIHRQFRRSLPDIHFESPGFVAHSEIGKSMSLCDVLLLIIPDTPNNKGIITGKLFEYLAARKPILLLGPADGDAADIVRKTGSGLICHPGDTESIRQALQILAGEKSELKLPVRDEKEMKAFSRRQQTRTMAGFLEGLLSTPMR